MRRVKGAVAAGARVDLRRQVEWLALLDPVYQLTTLRRLSVGERRTLDAAWPVWAHAGQMPAVGSERGDDRPDDGFAMLDGSSVRVIDLPLAAIGREVRVMASGVDDPRAVEARATVHGLAVRPPPPAQVRAERTADGVLLRWARRSRAGWRSINGVEVPLGEEAERYRITLIAADGGVREIESEVPWLAVAGAAWAEAVCVEVRQRGTWAESWATTIEGGDRR
ncbi:hypothetical protein [Sphingomonas rubra]|uniref:Phage tail protein n=1 Tax=Sphingomonas rubra TaxID=634430 RepID=A0A1I5TJT0_9SPHN|nr:hypothetical protein [Sphingomonas rubra]SFP82907.1 hypothetical protein SAMN04488241_10867 [Sphingomonas rubra]